MCAEPCSNYSLAQTPSLLWRCAQSLSSRFPPGIALHGDEWELILGIKMLFPWCCGGSGNAVSCCLKCTLLARRPAAASRTARRFSEDPKAFRWQEFQKHGGLLLGRLQSCRSRYSCSRLSCFSLASQPWRLGNPTSNESFSCLLWLPMPFLVWGCGCLSVTIFHGGCSMCYLIRLGVPI